MTTILARRYSSYLTSEFQYDRRINFWDKAFTSIYENIVVNIRQVNSNGNNHNKYKPTTNIIYDLSQYDVLKVYNVCLDTIHYLLSSIQKENVLGLKKILNEIPNNKKVILNDWYLQQTCFTDVNGLYAGKKRLNINYLTEFENFYTSLQSPSFHVNLENDSFIQKCVLIQHVYQTNFFASKIAIRK